MAIVKCAGCGALIEIPNNKNFIFCSECGTKCQADAAPIGSALLKRGYLALEDAEWTNAKNFFEQSLNENPECADAYLGKLLADLKLKAKEDLKNCAKPFDGNNNYSKIIRFASDDLKAEIEGYIEFINTRNSSDATENEYLAASKIANTSKSSHKLHEARKRLIALGDYKDAPQLADKCAEKYVAISSKSEKTESIVLKIISVLSTAVALLIIIAIVIPSLIIPTFKYNNAINLIEKEQYAEGIKILSELKYFKDSQAIISDNILHLIKGNTIAADYNHTFAVNEDGTVSVTGYREEIGYYHKSYKSHYCDNCSVESWEDIVAISVGENVTAGLKSDGTVVTTNSDISISQDKIIQIAAGDDHVVALMADGTVTYDHAEWKAHYVSEWTDIVCVAAGANHTVGLKSDGTVVATGDKDNGQCNVESWKDIVTIAAYGNVTVGIKADGTIVTTQSKSDISDWQDIVAIANGNGFTVGLKSNGTLVTTSTKYTHEISKLRDVVSIAAGNDHIVALKSNGKLVAIGDNEYNQCNVDTWESIRIPQ